MRKKRFYEEEAELARMVELLLVFPLHIQDLIGEGINALAEIDFQASELINDVKSLDPDKLLALYKSKTRRRDYDRSPTVHRAMVVMYFLEPAARRQLARKTVHLMSFIKDYLQLCRNHAVPGEPEHLVAIRDAFVRQGPEEATQVLKALDHAMATGQPVGERTEG